MIDINKLRARLSVLDSSCLSDAMDSLDLNMPRALPGFLRVNGRKLAGPVFTVIYADHRVAGEAFQNAGTYIDDVPTGHVILVDSQGRGDCTNWGDLLTEVSIRNGLAGTIVHGAVRDIDGIEVSDYPVFASAINAVSGKNRTVLTHINEPVTIGDVVVSPGDWVFADGSAVLRLPAHDLAEIIRRAEVVAATEERIITAIRSGRDLAEARKTYRYDRPWDANA